VIPWTLGLDLRPIVCRQPDAGWRSFAAESSIWSSVIPLDREATTAGNKIATVMESVSSKSREFEYNGRFHVFSHNTNDQKAEGGQIAIWRSEVIITVLNILVATELLPSEQRPVSGIHDVTIFHAHKA
jgi:hypothetical protein